MSGERENSAGLVIKFKKRCPEAKLPTYAHTTDAAFDIYTVEGYVLQPGERYRFMTGLASEIPQGWCVVFKEKSGLGDKYGIAVLAGLIDADYRGEWGVILHNTGDKPCEFKIGDKLTQGKVERAYTAQIEEVQELSETDRGTGGFGSTGK